MLNIYTSAKINDQHAYSHLNSHVTPPLEHNKGISDFVGVNRTLAAVTNILLDVLCSATNKESRLGPRGVLPYLGHMCHWTGYGFLAFAVLNRLYNLTCLSPKQV